MISPISSFKFKPEPPRGGSAWPNLADGFIAGELLYMLENKAPVHDSFRFEYIADKLQAAADYLLQYTLQPAVPSAPVIMAGSRLLVKPGKPSKFALEVCLQLPYFLDAMRDPLTEVATLHDALSAET